MDSKELRGGEIWPPENAALDDPVRRHDAAKDFHISKTLIVFNGESLQCIMDGCEVGADGASAGERFWAIARVRTTAMQMR